jgi:hypothetical protein
VKEEGGGDTGIEAAANYVTEAVRRFKLNETLNSKPYVLFNSWTKRHEFHYVKESTIEHHRQEFIEQKNEQVRVRSLAPCLAGASADAVRRVPAATVPARQSRGKKQAASLDANPVACKTARKAPETDLDKADKKLVEAQLGRVKAIRSRYCLITIAYKELKVNINEKPEWIWAQSSEITSPLDAAHQEVTDFINSHEFWVQWSVMNAGPTFNSYAKSTFDLDDIKEQLGNMMNLDIILKCVKVQVNSLLKMHSCRRACDSACSTSSCGLSAGVESTYALVSCLRFSIVATRASVNAGFSLILRAIFRFCVNRCMGFVLEMHN